MHSDPGRETRLRLLMVGAREQRATAEPTPKPTRKGHPDVGTKHCPSPWGIAGQDAGGTKGSLPTHGLLHQNLQTF